MSKLQKKRKGEAKFYHKARSKLRLYGRSDLVSLFAAPG